MLWRGINDSGAERFSGSQPLVCYWFWCGDDVYSFKSAPSPWTPSTWMKVCKHSALWLYSGLWVSVVFSYTHGTSDSSAWLLCPIGVSRPYSSNDWFEFCFTYTHTHTTTTNSSYVSWLAFPLIVILNTDTLKKYGSGYGISVWGKRDRWCVLL